VQLSPEFIATIHRVFGDDGRVWLPCLPDILAQCRSRWDLREGASFAGMSLNYLEFTTTADGEPVALKVGVPHSELYTEMEALALYDGHRAVRLLDADRELGALLLQRLLPGTRLWEIGDNAQETHIAASIIGALHARTLHAPPPDGHSFPTFARWVSRAFHLTRTEWDPEERMPRDLLGQAERAFQEIERTAERTVVLHGDLHHENILYDERAGWTAIDPKGAIGAPILEVGRYVQNQLPSKSTPAHRAALVRERIQVFGDALGYAPQAVAASALVDCVLSHCWCFEDEELGEDWMLGIELGRLLCVIASRRNIAALPGASYRDPGLRPDRT
jgi:streptomycin 6-kinase